MILPQDEHSIRIIRKFGKHGKRRSGLVCKGRRRTCCVKRYTNNLGGYFRGTLLQSLLDSFFKCIKVVRRMLTPLTKFLVAVQSSLPTCEVSYAGSYTFAGFRIDQKRTNTVRAVVESYNVSCHAACYYGLLSTAACSITKPALYASI